VSKNLLSGIKIRRKKQQTDTQGSAAFNEHRTTIKESSRAPGEGACRTGKEEWGEMKAETRKSRRDHHCM
jgi:hypothetical protein